MNSESAQITAKEIVIAMIEAKLVSDVDGAVDAFSRIYETVEATYQLPEE